MLNISYFKKVSFFCFKTKFSIYISRMTAFYFLVALKKGMILILSNIIHSSNNYLGVHYVKGIMLYTAPDKWVRKCVWVAELGEMSSFFNI